MGIARFITMAGLIAGCALMIPIALGALAEVLASLGSQRIRDNADHEAARVPEPLSYPIRSSGSFRSPGLRIAAVPQARASGSAGSPRSARDAA